MTRFRFECREVDEVLWLRLRGILDGSSAWELRNALEGSKAREIVLDMHGLVEIWDFGAAVLAAGLRQLGATRLTILHASAEIEEWLERFAVPAESRTASSELWGRAQNLRV